LPPVLDAEIVHHAVAGEPVEIRVPRHELRISSDVSGSSFAISPTLWFVHAEHRAHLQPRGLTDTQLTRKILMPERRRNKEAEQAVETTRESDEAHRFMKPLIGGDVAFLGFTMIGSEAGEVMAAVQPRC
jgi:hypothetical protein